MRATLSSEEWNTKNYHIVAMLLYKKMLCVCAALPCLCCGLATLLRKCMANCCMGPTRPSKPGTDGGITSWPEMPSLGAFSREPRVSSTLSTSSPQCLVNSLISICAQQNRMHVYDETAWKPAVSRCNVTSPQDILPVWLAPLGSPSQSSWQDFGTKRSVPSSL